jgi:hypothetical protein
MQPKEENKVHDADVIVEGQMSWPEEPEEEVS